MDVKPNVTESPTGFIGSRPADVLRNRYPRGNPESVRQMKLRMHQAEENVARYRSRVKDLEAEKGKLTKELFRQKEAVNDFRKAYQKREEELLHQLHSKNHREDFSSKIEEILNRLQVPETRKAYEPPFHLPEKILCLDAKVGTDEDLCSTSLREFALNESGRLAMIREPIDALPYKAAVEEKNKLTAEKFTLETQLAMARARLEQMTKLETEIEILKERVLQLSDANDSLIKENETLKDKVASCLNNQQGSTAELRTVVDVTLAYQERLDKKKAEFELTTRQFEELRKVHNAAIMELDLLKEENKKMKAEAVDMSQSAPAGEIPQKIIQKYEDEISELKERLSKYETSSESDTTKILHFRYNPLDLAHKEYKEFENARKRKQEASLLYDSDTLDASIRKKQRDDLAKKISDLEFQLHKVENEKERAHKIQSDLIKKYRAIVTALSGWQIKMKDEGLAQVESIFNPGHFFIFKVEDWGKSISLLETEYAEQWAQQIEEYLQCGNSTPSFLAAVTLVLDKRTDTSHCTFTFNHSE